MSSSDFDRRLNDWFDAVEPNQIPTDILPHVFRRVRHAGQQRGLLHRFTAAVEAAWAPRSRLVHGLTLAVLTALLIVALAVAAVAAGLIRLPARPTLVVDGLIAVEDAQEQEGDQRIRFIDPRTGDDAFVTPTTVHACAAKFSPDGSRYVFLYQPEGETTSAQPYVAVAPANDFQPTLLVRKEAQGYFDPSWAPDGSAVVVTMEVAIENGYYSSLSIVPTDGKPVRRLTEIHSHTADWSSDGEWIALVSIDPESALYVVRPDGSDLRLLREGPVGSPDWSPVGAELVYGASDGTLHVIAVDGTERFAVGPTGAPVWSPDGSKIAAASGGLISIFDTTTATVIRTIALQHSVVRLAWSPTGRTLAVVTSGAVSYGGDLWEVPVDGSPARLLAEGIRPNCMSSGAALSWQEVR